VKNDKTKKILFAIFIFALFLRLYAVFNYEAADRPLVSDAKAYDVLAVNFMSGEGFSMHTEGVRIPTSKRGPVYPLFLAGIYFVFGHTYDAVRVIQALLGALLCVIIFFIAHGVYSNKRIAFIASFIVAIYKPFISGFHYYGGPAFILSEYFYMFILSLSILFLIVFIKKEDKRIGILADILIGLTILTRAEFVLYPFILVFYLFYAARFSLRDAIKRYFIIYLFIALTMAPWIIRNYVVHKEFVPFTTLGGLVLWTGNTSESRGAWAFPQDYTETMDKTKDFSEVQKNRFLFRKGMQGFSKNVKERPGLFIKKTMVHWAPFEKGFEIFNLSYALVLLLGGIGILFFRKKLIGENFLITALLNTAIVAILMYGDPRYRYPYEFCLIIFSAVTINEIFKRLGNARTFYPGKCGF